MELYDNSLPTYLDIARGYGKDNEILPLVDTLSQTNELLLDAVPVECNNGMKHVFSTVLEEPKFYVKRFNMGTPDSNFKQGSAEESCAMFEGRAQIDAELLKMSKNKADYLVKRDKQFLAKFNKDMAGMLMYASVADDASSFNGIATRYATTKNTLADQIIDAGGKANEQLTSIYLVVWSDTTVHTLYPEGSTLGLEKKDLGIQTIQQIGNDGETLSLEVQRTKFAWKLGLAVLDGRYIVRISNISLKDLRTGTGTQAPNAQTNIVRLMIDAMNTVPSLSAGRPAFYMNRYVYSSLQKQGLMFSGNVLSFLDASNQFAPAGQQGKSFGSFSGIPMRRVDAIKIDEAHVA